MKSVRVSCCYVTVYLLQDVSIYWDRLHLNDPFRVLYSWFRASWLCINPYPTAFPYGNGIVLHFYQQQESSMTKTVHKFINKGLKAYV